MYERNQYLLLQPSGIVQTGILGKTRGRGEQRIPNWSDVARCEAAVDLEVGPGHVAAIVGGNWGDHRMSALKGPGQDLYLRKRAPFATSTASPNLPMGRCTNLLSRFSAVLRKSINRAGGRGHHRKAVDSGEDDKGHTSLKRATGNS
jgi:hypothetical protein